MKILFYKSRSGGLTCLDVFITTACAFAVLGCTLLAVSNKFSNRSAKCEAQQISCAVNLKQIGQAIWMWERDHQNKSPFEISVAEGGMREVLTNQNGAGAYTCYAFSLMQKELGPSPKTVICPSDERITKPHLNLGFSNGFPFPTWVSSNKESATLNNTNVSYFIAATSGSAVTCGDRNLGNGGKMDPSTGVVANPEQDRDYGISGDGSPCGADATITKGMWTSAKISGGGGKVESGSEAIAWSAKMHSCGSIKGFGNILLEDGATMPVGSKKFRDQWRANQFGESTNIKSVRFLFP